MPFFGPISGSGGGSSGGGGGAAVASAVVRRTTTQSVGTGLSAVSFDTVDVNNGGLFNSGAPTRLTAPFTGLYHIGGTVYWPSATTNRVAGLIRNGSDTDQVGFDLVATGGLYSKLSEIVHLTAGDFIEMKCGAGTTVNIGPDDQSAITFWMVKQ